MDNLSVTRYALTDSTNTRAKEYIANGGSELPRLFIAREQSAGRGRMGRSFYSPASTGLYATLLFCAPQEQERLLSLTALAAVALSEAIEDTLGISVEIKWVNDLYKDGKKVAGILAESFNDGARRYIALGFGVNLYTSSFPDDIKDKASSLCNTAISEESADSIALLCAKKLLSFVALENTESIMNTYRDKSLVLEKKIIFSRDGVICTGVAKEITALGALKVALDGGGEALLSTGEISIFLQ